MNKQEALANALSMIEKQFGKWSIMKLWDKENLEIETTSSWSLWLDIALGGWYAKWRIVEIYGPESSWKTTLTLHAIAGSQKAWWVAAFIDAEHALDPSYAKKIWVDTDNLIISQPDYGEQALEIVDSLVRSAALDLIIVDSVAALTPKALCPCSWRNKERIYKFHFWRTLLFVIPIFTSFGIVYRTSKVACTLTISHNPVDRWLRKFHLALIYQRVRPSYFCPLSSIGDLIFRSRLISYAFLPLTV